MRDLIQMITSVSSDRIQMTIFEGLKMQEIALLFFFYMDMDVEKFLSLCYDQNLINSLRLFLPYKLATTSWYINSSAPSL